jgi:hypothetical protein
LKLVRDEPLLDPCQSHLEICGPNSQCRNVNTVAVCSCLPSFIGSPPNCRPECVYSSDCNLNEACLNQKCKDPCPGTCGIGAKCQVINHNPICSCPPGHTGDPFTRCQPIPIAPPLRDPEIPCQPSPCGPNSQCREVNSQAVCSCIPNYIGSPPGCRPECTSNSECSTHHSCINRKCKDPCLGSCGSSAICHTSNHQPICRCSEGYTGDPFSGCYPIPCKTYFRKLTTRKNYPEPFFYVNSQRTSN